MDLPVIRLKTEYQCKLGFADRKSDRREIAFCC